jgi:intracellular septation protein
MTETIKPQLNPLLKLALDLGPLALFFFANSRYGIFVATATFMVAVLAALAVSYVMTRTLPDRAGGHRDRRCDLRRTDADPAQRSVHQDQADDHLRAVRRRFVRRIVLRQVVLDVVFDSLFHLTDEGWRKLTLRWAVFFFTLAVLNEIVWRNTSTNVWVDFKVFGFLPLTLVFGALQYPLLKKYAAAPAE